jgi:ubiquinone/menaquinone biosynthesis C-methylase UbiE
MSQMYDRFMRKDETARLRHWRRELLGDIRGDVLEIGAGTGANVPFYGEAVGRLVLSEPDRHMRNKLGRRVSSTQTDCEIIDAAADNLLFDDGSFDAVVSMLVLCSTADPVRAVAEIHRVLRPGGTLVFLEHVAADDGSALHRAQQRWEPLWKRFAGNCHLTRQTEKLIARGGFTIDRLKTEHTETGLKLASPMLRGHAVKKRER